MMVLGEHARRTQCLSNLKQIGRACTQDTQDSDETRPFDSTNDPGTSTPDTLGQTRLAAESPAKPPYNRETNP